jgi:hypothetical protein
MTTRCTHYTANARCSAEAEVLMHAPDGKPVPGGRLCGPHGRMVAEEYLAKLAETWPLVPIAEEIRA